MLVGLGTQAAQPPVQFRHPAHPIRGAAHRGGARLAAASATLRPLAHLYTSIPLYTAPEVNKLPARFAINSWSRIYVSLTFITIICIFIFSCFCRFNLVI